MGLLLVTKLLPAADPASVRAVKDAIGFTFINRLLRSPLPAGAPPEEKQKQVRSTWRRAPCSPRPHLRRGEWRGGAV